MPAMGLAAGWLSPMNRLLQGSEVVRFERGRAGGGGTNKNAAGGLLSTSGLIRCFHGS
jgi:hypothetical protein